MGPKPAAMGAATGIIAANSALSTEPSRVSFKSLLNRWQQHEAATLTAAEYSVRLPVDDAARLHALVEMFPGCSKEQIITDLLSAAFREVSASMPYVRGSKVISTDEQGDPVFEDAGHTPQFAELTRKHRKKLALATKE